MVINSLAPHTPWFWRDGARRAHLSIIRYYVCISHTLCSVVCTVVSDGRYVVNNIVTCAGIVASIISVKSWSIRAQVASKICHLEWLLHYLKVERNPRKLLCIGCSWALLFQSSVVHWPEDRHLRWRLTPKCWHVMMIIICADYGKRYDGLSSSIPRLVEIFTYATNETKATAWHRLFRTSGRRAIFVYWTFGGLYASRRTWLLCGQAPKIPVWPCLWLGVCVVVGCSLGGLFASVLISWLDPCLQY